MKKGDDTKIKILDKGFELASKLGLECLSIGTLATATDMSKSGLFGHFHSKENLQLNVMEHAGEIFNQDVIAPALKAPAGIPRIRKIMENWIHWTKELSGGCIFVAAAAEYSDRPGLVRDFILEQQKSWIDCLGRIAGSAVRVGDFRADTNCDLFAFELYSLILGFFLYHSSLDYPGAGDLMSQSFERLINSYKP
ncbi:MAG: TetR/AcrR family transcriptional regulator [Proteobacteria bacterium]|nr:TetR/AcrR family transcriptional regulator [Pseudomonadota bacterium]MBU1583929.1 TetR/AcrR family transcriptional regulator [Pseudomonadota bacterium]MBU2454319.1 TetR/AcrR family transcriptional regulator [Pseudomonadota bacterium]MBU2627390.1 TetR/AcrR family transcriptional regulator [Pseudomonadota bacterium]